MRMPLRPPTPPLPSQRSKESKQEQEEEPTYSESMHLPLRKTNIPAEMSESERKEREGHLEYERKIESEKRLQIFKTGEEYQTTGAPIRRYNAFLKAYNGVLKTGLKVVGYPEKGDIHSQYIAVHGMLMSLKPFIDKLTAEQQALVYTVAAEHGFSPDAFLP